MKRLTKVDPEFSSEQEELVARVNTLLIECNFTHAEWNGEDLVCFTIDGKTWHLTSLLNYYGIKNDWAGLENMLEETFDSNQAPIQFIRTTNRAALQEYTRLVKR